jgi:acetyl esterase/lipase
MEGTPAEGNVRAKTGTLRWANALSGYVTTAARERLAFSLMLNRGVAQEGRSKRDELDAVALMLAEFSGRSDTTMASLYAGQGQLILTQLVHAPFPHPARSEGHSYRDQFFPRDPHYTDSTVAIFIPQQLKSDGRVDVVVHFHGWGNSVEGTLSQFGLVEQLLASQRQAVLVVPAGPRFASDSFGGKLEEAGGFQRFVEEVLDVLRDRIGSGVEPGNIILSGHSGGYRVMAAILDRGGLSDRVGEVWIFDGLYAGTDVFLGWQQSTGGRLLNIFTENGGTKDDSTQAMEEMRKAGTPFLLKDEASVTAEDLRGHRVVFLKTDLGHSEVVAKRETFRRFLETSLLR